MAIVEREIYDALLTGVASVVAVGTWEDEYAEWFEQVKTTVIAPLAAGERELAEEQWRERSAEAAALQGISEGKAVIHLNKEIYQSQEIQLN
ncbi:hypothetical protein [Bacillus sp. JCM 19041]|uniref:hypothetical protein n=1 Tax=Bacillus sp. JCM 19041 TaxID=1460637 RepID=UPI0006D2B42D